MLALARWWLAKTGHIAHGLYFGVERGRHLGSHETRALYSRIQVEEHASDNLDSEYERLLLEQSAWAGYNRVDQLAREELQMQTPRQANLVLMRRSPRLLQTASLDGDQE